MRQLSRAARHARRYVTNANDRPVGLNAFINIPPIPITSATSPQHGNSGDLKGHTVAVKDNICTSFLPTTCGSAGLRDFTPPYNATVVDHILAAQASIVGKTNLDEFGMGSNSIHSFFGPVSTEKGHSAGGSSGGSAVAVASDEATSAVGTDTGGSVRLPAAYNGIVGFKPSYGLVSRWGVVAYANSLDTVGFMAKNVDTARKLFTACNKHDPKDPTSLSPSTRGRLSQMRSSPKSRTSLRIGVPQEYNVKELTPEWRDLWARSLHRLQQHGHTIHNVGLPHTRQALSAYYILAPAEASSNLAKYDGVRYGSPEPPSPDSSTPSPPSSPLNSATTTPSTSKLSSPNSQSDSSPGNNLYTATRGHMLGAEVRRRILLGSYTLSATAKSNYFVRAQQIRRLVVQDFDDVFTLSNPLHLSRNSAVGGMGEDQGVDILLTPTTPGSPPMLAELEAETEREPVKEYMSDVFTVPASLAGLPAVSVPGVEGWGTQVIGQFGDDEAVLTAAEIVEALR